MFLKVIHDVYCSFKVSSSEVNDIASSVFEALSVILEKGQKLKVQQPKDKQDRVVTYGELFSVKEILPIGSFVENTKIVLPNEFDFNIKLDVGELTLNEGCRPGRVRVTFKSNRQVWFKNLGQMFTEMIAATVETMTDDENEIIRESGTLLITAHRPCLQLQWKGANHKEFDIKVDIMPAISCTDKFIAELAEDENFPSNFYNLIKEHPCYLVPKPCSPDCRECFHVSFAQAELCLMKSLDECHRRCYRVLKYLLVDHILNSYQIKMAILHHVYVQKCKTPLADLGEVDAQCVLGVLDYLLCNYLELKMPTFFLHNCCVITKDGEGTQAYLDYLVDATDLDLSTLPFVDMEVRYSYKNYDWLDIFAWFEFQKRCLLLLIEVLLYVAKFPPHPKSFSYFHRALKIFVRNNTRGIWHEGGKLVASLLGRPTAREWVDIIPHFSSRVFIPAFSLILEEIKVIFPNAELKYSRFVGSASPIRLCAPCPVMGYSQASMGSFIFYQGNLLIRMGAMCYFARLEGKSWLPVAFGKMSFIETREALGTYISDRVAFYEALERGLSSLLVRGNIVRPDAGSESVASADEIPDFKGPFFYNVRYDGEAFQQNIISIWHFKRCLIIFLLQGMLTAIYLRNLSDEIHQRFNSTNKSTAIVKARR